MSASIDLYSFIHFDRGSRVRWLANELGLTIKEHRLDARAGEHKGAAYRAVNPTDLVPDDRVWVHVDGAHRGLGSAACGPEPHDRHRLRPGRYRWSWTMELR